MKFRHLFCKRTPAEYALDELEDHQRDLVKARQNLHAAITNAAYHEGCISELKQLIETFKQDKETS